MKTDSLFNREVRSPTPTKKKKGKCLGHNLSYSADSEAKPEALKSRMGFLKTSGNSRHLVNLCILVSSFSLHLPENRLLLYFATILNLNRLWTSPDLALGHQSQWHFTHCCRSIPQGQKIRALSALNA